MRLDYQILLKFPPLKLLVGPAPALGSLARTIAVAKPCRIIVVCIFAWRVIKAVFAAKITRFWRHYVELGEIVLCAVSAWRLTQCFRRSVRIRCRSSAEIVNVAKCSFEFFFSHRKVKVGQKHISQRRKSNHLFEEAFVPLLRSEFNFKTSIPVHGSWKFGGDSCF